MSRFNSVRDGKVPKASMVQITYLVLEKYSPSADNDQSS